MYGPYSFSRRRNGLLPDVLKQLSSTVVPTNADLEESLAKIPTQYDFHLNIWLNHFGLFAQQGIYMYVYSVEMFIVAQCT